jgi:hypothetical protein
MAGGGTSFPPLLAAKREEGDKRTSPLAPLDLNQTGLFKTV